MATVLCLCSATSWADLVVTFDNIFVTPGTATATSFVRISSDQTPLEEFNTANINLQVVPVSTREILLDNYDPIPSGNVWDGAPISSFASPVLDGTIQATKISTTINNGTNVAADGDILFSVDFNTSEGLAGDFFVVNLDNLDGINVSNIKDAAGFTLTAGGGVTFSPGFISFSAVPEPSSFLMMGLCGCLGLAVQLWRKFRPAP
jgi:hypothetical protein